MTELLGEALKLYNFPLTLALGIVFGFWIFTIVGVVDSDSLEPDLDLDAEADADVEAEGGSSGILNALKFFNLGEIPLTVLLSVLSFCLWFLSVMSNYHWNPGGSWLVAGGFFLANAIVSLFLTKILTAPLKPMMRSLKAGSKHQPVVGRICVIKTSEVSDTFGQAEAEDEHGPILINVRCSDTNATFQKGDQALVVDHHPDSQTYLVRKLDALENPETTT